MWRRYTVFNVEQAEGLKLPERAGATPGWEAQQNVEKVIAANGVKIREVNGDRAYYNMAGDEIVLPERAQFKNAEGYYQTALHEVGHSTGHPDRLNRESLHQGIQDGFGSEAYAREELRAEISAMMSSDRLGVAYEPQHGNRLRQGVGRGAQGRSEGDLQGGGRGRAHLRLRLCSARARPGEGHWRGQGSYPPQTGEKPERGRAIPEPVVAREVQPATPVAAKAPEIELSR